MVIVRPAEYARDVHHRYSSIIGSGQCDAVRACSMRIDGFQSDRLGARGLQPTGLCHSAITAPHQIVPSAASPRPPTHARMHTHTHIHTHHRASFQRSTCATGALWLLRSVSVPHAHGWRFESSLCGAF